MQPSTTAILNLATIHAEVVKVMEPHSAKIEQRRNAIALLREGLAQQNAQLLPMLRSRKAWFSTTQTDTSNPKLCIRLQLLGLDVGALRFSCEGKPEEPSFWFYPKKHLVTELRFPDGPWKWSHDPKAGKIIRQFLDKCKTIRGAGAHNEREIQWQLANALQTGDDDALRYLQPVTWNGCYTEIGVSVNKTGQPGTGNIDLLVRRGRGWQGGFIVFELKKPGDKGVVKALQQALRYATALNLEANGGDPVNQANYRAVFGSRGNAKLKIGVAVVLEDDDKGIVRRNAPAVMQQYWAKREPSFIDRIGVLLYKFDPKAKKAKNWEWLSGWDARERPPSSEQTAD